jgi:hypothetical protein
MEKADTKRILVTVHRDFDEKFTAWAARLGVSKSQFGSMCLQAGMNSLVRAVAPEEGFSPEVMVKILQEAQKQGMLFDTSGLSLKKD